MRKCLLKFVVQTDFQERTVFVSPGRNFGIYQLITFFSLLIITGIIKWIPTHSHSEPHTHTTDTHTNMFASFHCLTAPRKPLCLCLYTSLAISGRLGMGETGVKDLQTPDTMMWKSYWMNKDREG